MAAHRCSPGKGSCTVSVAHSCCCLRRAGSTCICQGVCAILQLCTAAQLLHLYALSICKLPHAISNTSLVTHNCLDGVWKQLVRSGRSPSSCWSFKVPAGCYGAACR